MAEAPGAVVGTAVLQVVPSMRGGIKSLEKELGGSLGTAGSSAGKKFSGGFSKATKGIGKTVGNALKGGAFAAGATVLGATGMALNKGFERLDNIDKAEAKLKGLGHTQKSVDKIMDSAMASVKGTAFGLGDAATVASTTVAAGVKPGKELERTLTIIGDSATIAGVGMDEMGAIFNKVAAGGKLTTETMQQMQERGIPVMQFLSKETGKSVAQVQEDLSAGKITFEQFQTAMEKNLGGAAQESGKTFSGAMANVKAAMGRLGASFLSPLFESGPGVLTKITEKIDLLGPVADKAGRLLGKAFGAIGDIGKTGLSKAGDLLERFGPSMSNAFDTVAGAVGRLVPHFKQFGSDMADLWPTIKSVGAAVWDFLVATFKAVMPYLKTAAAIFGVVLVGAMKVLPPVLSAVMNVFKGLLNTIRPLLPVITSLAAGTAIYMGLMKAAAILKFVKALRLQTLATKGATLAQRALNLVMRLNPIGLIITAITLLVGTLIYLYKNNETVRNFINKAWAGIKNAITSVVNWFTQTAWPALRTAFTAVAKVAMWLWNSGIKPAFTGIGRLISWWYNNVVKRYFALVSAVFRGVARVAMWLWTNGIKPAFDLISGGIKWLVARVRSIPAGFTDARNKISAVWAKVREVVVAPIRWAGRWISRSVAGWSLIFSRVRSAISKIWNRIKNVIMTPIRWAGNWVKRSVLGWRLIFSRARDLIRVIWSRIREFVMSPIRSAVDWIKKKIDQVRTGFAIVRDRVRAVWARMNEFVRAPIRKGVDWVKKKIDTLRGVFTRVRDALGKVWDKMYGKIQSPFKKARTWINDKFIAGINKLLGEVGIKADTFRVPKIAGFAKGGWTGPGSRYAPAGVVHRDEFVVSKPSRRKFERENPGTLDYINRHGTLPGYAIGGKVAGLNKRFLDMLSRFNAAAGGRYSVNSGYRSNAHQRVLYNRYLAGRGPVAAKPGSSMHNRGLAADLAPSNARDVHGGLAKQFGLVFTVPSESWHIEPSWGRGSNAGPSTGGGDGGGGGWLPEWVKNPLGWAKSKVKGLMDNFKPDDFGIAGHMWKAVSSKVTDGIGKKIKEAASLFDFGGGGGSSMNFSGIKGGSNKTIGKQMAERYGWTGAQWSALSRLWDKESNWNHRAKNPSSGAYGIPQSLPASKMASAGADWQTNPGTQIAWGLKYIKDRYGSPSAALSFHNRRNWYSDGGRVKPLLFDSGGYLPTGTSLVQNNTGKPEPLKRMHGGESPNITVYVQSPWGPEYMESKVRDVVDDEFGYSSTIERMR